MVNTLIFFAEKMWVAFALQNAKATHIFAAKMFENTLATTVNEFVINELFKLTMLWITGPRLRGCTALFKSSLGTHVRRYILSRYGTFFSWATHFVILLTYYHSYIYYRNDFFCGFYQCVKIQTE